MSSNTSQTTGLSSSLSTSATTTFPTSSASSSSSPTAPATGSGGDHGSNNNPSTSATLYLYTFLATLVLLLSVSAAIILRSLYLRRRHQRLVEEAIRNGTWVPPSPNGAFPFGNNGRRVDLSKKPALWEAFVGSGARHTHRTGKAETVTEWEWDSIRPFAAAYVTPPSQSDSEAVASNVMPQERASLTARLHTLMRNRHQSTFPIPARMATTTPITVPAATLPSSTAPPSTAPVIPDPPQKVRVAVLIAMPQPPEAKSRSSTPQPIASTSATTTSLHSTADEEPELPHIEFGVAELDVSSSHDKLNRTKEVRSSVASGSSVV
ncbi:hypothetical protein C0993_008374 [Termitomyces sp. T159_Od127]|nr:hypothetical protein C0993_008374 [Termitomyces sp. T159_Od127]